MGKARQSAASNAASQVMNGALAAALQSSTRRGTTRLGKRPLRIAATIALVRSAGPQNNAGATGGSQ